MDCVSEWLFVCLVSGSITCRVGRSSRRVGIALLLSEDVGLAGSLESQANGREKNSACYL